VVDDGLGVAWGKVTAVVQASGFHRRNSLSKDGTFYHTCRGMDQKGWKNRKGWAWGRSIDIF